VTARNYGGPFKLRPRKALYICTRCNDFACLCVWANGLKSSDPSAANIAEYPANCMNDVSATNETNARVMEWLLRGKYASADGLAPDLLRCQLKVDGLALRAATPELQNNRSIVQQAVKENGLALQFASYELRSDKDIVLKAVRCSGGALEFASADLRADSEVVLESVYDCGGALEFASEDLRGDEAVVTAAVRNYGGALEFASEKLRGDKTVVLEAVRSCAFALEYASEGLKADRYFFHFYDFDIHVFL
jgi:hypothetical protein